MDKNLYINDLQARYSDHTFTEVVTGSLTKVEFNNGSVLSSKSTMDVLDAYKNIRYEIIGYHGGPYVSTTVQRDALAMSAADIAVQIFNTDSQTLQIYNGSSWI